MQCVAVCCSVLQRLIVCYCCSVLQCVAVRYNVLQCFAMSYFGHKRVASQDRPSSHTFYMCHDLESRTRRVNCTQVTGKVTTHSFIYVSRTRRVFHELVSRTHVIDTGKVTTHSFLCHELDVSTALMSRTLAKSPLPLIHSKIFREHASVFSHMCHELTS